MATLPSGPEASFAFNAPASGGSLYRRALAAGVSDVLAAYESAILRLEQDILRGVTPALPAALESALSGFALVLPALHVTLRPVIERPDLKGAPLLHHLHAAALAAARPSSKPRSDRCAPGATAPCTAAPGVDRARRAGRPARGVLGQARGGAGGDGGVYLGDFDESGAAKGTGAGGVALGWQPDKYGLDDSIVDGELRRRRRPVLLWRRRRDPTPRRGTSSDDDPGDDGGEREWHRGFQVSLEALPPGVELPAAEAVLFAGRAVRVLTRPRGEFAGGSLLPDAVASRATEALRGLARVEGEGNDGEFDRLAFESTVEGIRAPVAARLGELVVRDAKLAKHLEALRSYHLLGRGDFFQSFFEEAASLLALPPRANTAEADAAAPFAAAALKSSAFDDPLLPRFRLRFVSPGGASATKGTAPAPVGRRKSAGPTSGFPRTTAGTDWSSSTRRRGPSGCCSRGAFSGGTITCSSTCSGSGARRWRWTTRGSR